MDCESNVTTLLDASIEIYKQWAILSQAPTDFIKKSTEKVQRLNGDRLV
jgi:hypothetical protein